VSKEASFDIFARPLFLRITFFDYGTVKSRPGCFLSMKAMDSAALLVSRRRAPTSFRDLALALGPALAAALSGVLLFAAFPPCNLWPAAWFSLVPLYWVIAGKSGGRAFLLGLLAGIIFFLGTSNWLMAVPSYKLLHLGILALYFGSWIGLFGFCLSRITRSFGLTVALLAAPFCCVALEFLRSNMFFMSLPWGVLAQSQYRVIPVIQMSSVTGGYGVSFLIVLVNSALFALLFPFVAPGSRSFSCVMGKLEKWGLLSLASTAVAATLVYGHFSIVDGWPGKSIRVAALQGNIAQHRKWDRKSSRFIMDTYDRLTREAARSRPDLIVWPESATPWYLDSSSGLYPEVKRLAKGAGACLLVGTAGSPKFSSSDAPSQPGLNSMVLIGPDTGFGTDQKYDKIRLLPFGEYLPLEKVIPWSYIGIPAPAPSISGEKTTLLSTPDFRFAAPICWENVFPDLIRGFVRDGAQFIVNGTNEAWFGRTGAPYQFLSISVFRAVENRRFVVRCANTGISCIIDPCGRVVDRVRDAAGNDICVTGVVNAQITCLDSLTTYTQYGDWLAATSLICAAALLLASLRRGRTKALPDGGAF
jgi:apolipoprotein N-acyltransferase